MITDASPAYTYLLLHFRRNQQRTPLQLLVYFLFLDYPTLIALFHAFCVKKALEKKPIRQDIIYTL